MLKKLMLIVSLAVLGNGFWEPEQAQALYVSLKSNTIHCDVGLASGGKPVSDDLVVCAVNIKEIGGFCVNKAGNAAPAKGQPFRLHGAVINSSSSSAWVKTKNGTQTNSIVITDNDIQHALDVYNAENNLPFVNLTTTTGGACPNGNWQWSGWLVTKADAALTWVKFPSGGSADYLRYEIANDPNQCRVLDIPTLNDDGSYKYKIDGTIETHQETNCNFRYEPFNYCSRLTVLGPDLKPADSGLRIYDSSGNLISVTDNYYKVRECLLWRDVNKDNAFNLSMLGTYNPDVNNIVPPQTGNADGGDDNTLGGIVLVSPYTYYTGECHQHGKETGSSSFNWSQAGPDKMVYDLSGNVISGDAMCTGGSQLLDGIYP